MSVSQIYMFVNSFIFSIFVCKRNLKGYGRRVRRTVVIMRRQDLMTRGPIIQSYTTTVGYDDHPRFTSWSRGYSRNNKTARLNDPEASWVLYYDRECFIDLEMLTCRTDPRLQIRHPNNFDLRPRWYVWWYIPWWPESSWKVNLTKSSLSLTVERFQFDIALN